MSIYVDPLFPCSRNKDWKYNEYCHLIGDTEKELHNFAKKLKLKRKWFHKSNHYDLTRNVRSKAVKKGAIEITRKHYERKMS